MVRTRKLPSPTASLHGLEDSAEVDSLRRGLEVLRLFDARHRALQLAEIADKLGLSRATALKLVSTLEAHNFLRAGAQAGSYEPHAACLALGKTVKRGLAVVQVALPYMQELSERYDVHMSLTTRDRFQMLVVEHCVPQGRMRLGLDTGTRIPLVASASGRAYLWAQPPAMRTGLIERLKEGLDDESSFKMMTSVYTALQEQEQQGWCFMSSPVATQSSSIATPILGDEGAEFALAALAVGPVEVEEKKLREAVAPELLRVAGAVAEALKRM